MKLSKNAITVLEKRYLIKDAEGCPVEGPEEMFRRVADTIAAGDKLYDPNADLTALSNRFYQLMTDLEFLPNSPTLMNAGRDLGQLSACFVLPVEDSMEDIFEAVKNAALIHKSGGGTGFSFSRLRQQGAMVRSTGGVASGPVSFMRVFNMATEAVKQGGTRRGANMGILRVDHPDILAFIDCKKDNADITNFNISVGITEAFMEAVEAKTTYDLIDPKTGGAVGSLEAVAVFDKIVDAAWRNGEPGIVFLDRLNRDNVVPGQGEIESTNPCGEQPLLPYEACNLGSINLAAMLREQEDGTWALDYDKLEQVIADAVHFLDNVIDVNKYPLEKIGEMTRSTRKIGLGVMGYADMLLRLGIGYNSDAAVALAQEVMAFVQDKAWEASRQLALVRGAFPLFEESTFQGGPLVRNATVTTIAPTGTLSIIAGCSSGVEPIFAYVYIRNVMDNTEMIESNPILEEVLRQRELYSPELMRRIAAEGTLAHLEELPQDLRDVFVCSHDIPPLYHIRTQAAFQRHTDNAVSKTVNFTHDATPGDVREVYLLAYREGCKGVTIYRDGSREGQVLNIGAPKAEATPEEEAQALLELEPREELDRVTRAAYGEVRPRPRPEVTYGLTERMKIGCGNLYVTVNYDENGICEVFTSTGKAGGCPSQSEATARLVSIALRSGVDPQEILDQLRGIRCPSTIRQPGMKCTSCPDAIAKVVKKVSQYIRELPPQEGGNFQPIPAMAMAAPAAEPARPRAAGPTGGREMTQAEAKLAKYCPECGARLEHEGGCVSCRSCGFSKCG